MARENSRKSAGGQARSQSAAREPGHDGNPPEFVPTRDLIGKGGKREPIDGPTNVNNNRLTMLEHRKTIDRVQRAAGERLAFDWNRASTMNFASSVMVGNGGSGGAINMPADVKIDAAGRVGDARRALGIAWPIVEAVCCFDLRIDEAASRLRLNPQRATGQLETGLDMLAAHYGMRRR